jgi:predicted transcriptional regulator
MPDQPIRDEIPHDRFSEEQIDNTVLGFMLYGASWPWTVEEIARELGDEANAADAILRLTRTGLVHRAGDFVLPTRTARRASALRIGTA